MTNTTTKTTLLAIVFSVGCFAQAKAPAAPTPPPAKAVTPAPAPPLTDTDKVALLQLSIEGKALQDAMSAFQAKAANKLNEIKTHYPGYEPKPISASDWVLEKTEKPDKEVKK